MKRLSAGVIGVLVCLAPGGCALTSKADALSPRYFNPQLPKADRAEQASQPFELRLGQVSSASNLDERMAYRLSAAEVGFYEDRRWTELPEAYLRRALEKELFEERRLTRVVAGAAPVLEVELTAFEELRQAPTRVRVGLTFSLRDDRRSLLEQSLQVEQPISDGDGADPAQRVAQALAASLAKAVRAVGGAVVERLAGPATPIRGFRDQENAESQLSDAQR